MAAELQAILGEGTAARESGDLARMRRANEALSVANETHLAAHRKGNVRSYAEVIVAAVLGAVVLRLFIAQAYFVPSGSMIPTLLPGDVILVFKLAYGLRLPTGSTLLPLGEVRRGDVIVFEHPAHEGERLVKRVVGLPGDRVELIDDRLQLGGVPRAIEEVPGAFEFWNVRPDLGYWYRESGRLFVEELDGRRHALMLSRMLARPRPPEGPFEVPAGHVFVLGDSRDNSEDGRSAGGWYVPLSTIEGRAVRILFSWGRTSDALETAPGFRSARSARAIDAFDGSLPLDAVAQRYAEALRAGGYEER